MKMKELTKSSVWVVVFYLLPVQLLHLLLGTTQEMTFFQLCFFLSGIIVLHVWMDWLPQPLTFVLDSPQSFTVTPNSTSLAILFLDPRSTTEKYSEGRSVIQNIGLLGST